LWQILPKRKLLNKKDSAVNRKRGKNKTVKKRKRQAGKGSKKRNPRKATVNKTIGK
jgi:hypothetical protein